jgi:putative membrane protein
MIAWFKFLHVAAIAVWMAGLIGLPGLYVQRVHVEGSSELYRLQRVIRFIYLKLVSPAAFLAVASGTALIFLTESFEAWLSVKLAFVGGLALTHALTGLVIIRLFHAGQVYPPWRFVAVTVVTGALVLCVLVVVLAKPAIDFGLVLPAVLFEPGGLRRLFEDISPWPIP